jgi:hypothetical protein
LEITNAIQLAEDDIKTDENMVQTILTDFASDDNELANVTEAYLRTIDEKILTEEILDDDGIIALIKPQEDNTDQESDDEIPPITTKEAIESLGKVIRYNEQLETLNAFNLETMSLLHKKLVQWERNYEMSKKQNLITTFFE